MKLREEKSRAGRRDVGATLIEMLVAIVLLGTVVAATLTGLTTTISAGALDRDHANAHAWLQTAADMLYARDLVSCGTDTDPMTPGVQPYTVQEIADQYEATIMATENPEGWADSNIQIINLEYWSIDIAPDGTGTEAWGTVCDAKDTNLQKVELRVTAEDGRIVEEVEVIIGG